MHVYVYMYITLVFKWCYSLAYKFVLFYLVLFYDGHLCWSAHYTMKQIACMYMHVHVCICMYMYVCMYIYMYMYTDVCTCYMHHENGKCKCILINVP